MDHDETRRLPTLFFDAQVQSSQDCHDRGLDYCYAHPKNIDLALQEFDTAIHMRESLFGKFHNDTSLSYFRKACVLREEKKDYYESLVVARRELRISQHLLGGKSDIPIVDQDREGGDVWLSERIQWFQEVLLSHRRDMNEDDVIKYSSQLLQALEFERIGDGHAEKEEWDLAITQYSCALAFETEAYGRSVLEMADLQVKIGDCYMGAGDFDAALEEYHNAEARYQEEFGGSPHSIFGMILSKCANIYLRRDDYDASLGTYAKIYAIYESVYGTTHEKSIEALNDLRLVTVKEMEFLRVEERRKRKVAKAERRETRAMQEREKESHEQRTVEVE